MAITSCITMVIGVLMATFPSRVASLMGALEVFLALGYMLGEVEGDCD